MTSCIPKIKNPPMFQDSSVTKSETVSLRRNVSSLVWNDGKGELHPPQNLSSNLTGWNSKYVLKCMMDQWKQIAPHCQRKELYFCLKYAKEFMRRNSRRQHRTGISLFSFSEPFFKAMSGKLSYSRDDNCIHCLVFSLQCWDRLRIGLTCLLLIWLRGVVIHM